MTDDLLAGRYRRVKTLGRGAMGEVWLAEDTLLGRSVAIKQFRTDVLGDDATALERISREARTAARLHHPNIVALHDLITVDGQPYLVMEYVEGESLADRLRRVGPMEPGEATGLFAQIARALDAAHRAGIVHRDVKPANILITPDGDGKLADFGIARAHGDAALTEVGHTIGTVAFMSPETARGGEATAASDVWSLGASLYAALEGHSPHGGTGQPSAATLLVRLVTEPVPLPRRAGPLAPLLQRLLSEPAKRPGAGEVARELAAVQTSPTVNTPLSAFTGADQGRPSETQLVEQTGPTAAMTGPTAAYDSVPEPTTTVATGQSPHAGQSAQQWAGVQPGNPGAPTWAAPGSTPGSPYGTPPPVWGQPAARAASAPSAPGRTALALLVLWGGIALVSLVIAHWHFVQRAGLPYEFGGLGFTGKGLHVGLEAGPRFVFALLTVAPLLGASALVARDASRWAVAAAGAILAGAIEFLFWFSGSSALWIVATLAVLAGFAGWLIARERGPAAYATLVPVAIFAALFYTPHNPGRWLRDLPGHLHIHATFVLVLWYVFAPVLVAGVAGLVAPLLARTGIAVSTRVLTAGLAGLAAVTVVAGVLAQTAFVHTADYDALNNDPTNSDTSSPSPATTLDADTARATVDSMLSDMENGSTASGCDGALDPIDVQTYTIDEVTPATAGTFAVSAAVTLTDGSTTTVKVVVGSDSGGSGCVQNSSVDTVPNYSPTTPSTPTTPTAPTTAPTTPAVTPPSDVPSVPNSSDPVPTDAALPDPPSDAALPYDSNITPTTSSQIVEYQPTSGLDNVQRAAIAGVITFMVDVNRQNLSAAYGNTIYPVSHTQSESDWAKGYRTSAYYQVAFGAPTELSPSLVIVPARWASHQDPTVQHRSDNSSCDYWPQYLFVMTNTGGRWRYTESAFQGHADIKPYEREDTVTGEQRINPVQQRIYC